MMPTPLRTSILEDIKQAGFIQVDLPSLYPAHIILDAAGEAARFDLLFLDENEQNAQCLRYDLTMPLCLHYLQSDRQHQRLTAGGSVFRRWSDGNEFYQISFEIIDSAQNTQDDTDIITLSSNIVQQYHPDFRLLICDIALLTEILAILPIDDERRQRLASKIYQPKQFLALLQRFSNPETDTDNQLAPLLDSMAHMPSKQGQQVAHALLSFMDSSHIGRRHAQDIADRLLTQAKNRQQSPLNSDITSFFQTLFKLQTPILETVEQIDRLGKEHGFDLGPALQSFQTRLDCIQPSIQKHMSWRCHQDRIMEYYTGLYFRITSHDGITLGGGGRYDRLLGLLSQQQNITAVGGSLRPDILERKRTS